MKVWEMKEKVGASGRPDSSRTKAPVKRRRIIKEYSWFRARGRYWRSILESRSKRRLRVDGPRRYKAVVLFSAGARQSTTSLVPCKKAISFLRGRNSLSLSLSLFLRAVCDISANSPSSRTRPARSNFVHNRRNYSTLGSCRKREIAFGRRSGKLCQPFSRVKVSLGSSSPSSFRFLGL